VSSHVIANPKNSKLKGYTPPTPLSVTHPRSTHALIESDGNIWVADFSTLAASDLSSGKEIDTKTGGASRWTFLSHWRASWAVHDYA
jgi:hypothetical protein